MPSRTERIVLETRNYRIIGDLHLPAGGYRTRLSDFLNREGLSFIPLVDAEVIPLSPNGSAQQAERREFIAIARDHVQLAYEA